MPGRVARAPGPVDTRVRAGTVGHSCGSIIEGDVVADSADSTPAIRVVPDHVLDAGKYVQLTADNLVKALQDLDIDIDAVLEVWKGNSATAYRVGWDETRPGTSTRVATTTRSPEPGDQRRHRSPRCAWSRVSLRSPGSQGPVAERIKTRGTARGGAPAMLGRRR
ncbi:WXG100 family type VII secretion target [Nocardia sp. NBC_01329]|uniref:WXG100 family type VII secretion target n=1 Tax=Nocardia sp. NBC_01329 TaxID=2903594 RepID=UPI003FA36BBF